MMKKTLIVYSTVDGHTILICEEIRKELARFNTCELHSIDEIQTCNLDEFDWIIIGASIRYGKHRKSVLNFMREKRIILQGKKTAFFSVNAVARKKEKSTPQSNPYVLKFIKNIGWTPNIMAVFAGKIDYPKYNLLDRWAIKLIMTISNGPTDTSSSFEFTDWSKVKEFVGGILARQKQP